MILHFLAAAATNILDICIHICLYASRKCFQDTYFWCASHSHKNNTNNKCVLESIGVFFCTPSNPFAHLGKIQRQRPHCDIYEDMFILSNLSYKHVLESISSRIYTYLGLILCLWNHTTRLRCFAWTCKLTWNFYNLRYFAWTYKLTWNFYNVYPVETKALAMKSDINFHVKTKHWRHFSWFHKPKIKSKYV